MKKIIRRLTAFALCAILAAAMPLASAQELFTPEGVSLTVQIAVTLPNGTLSFLPVTPVTSTMGDTVYWVDESMLSDDEIALLATAQLQLTSETGELYAELPLSDVGFAGAIDERLDVVSDMIPGGSLTILPAESAAPMDGEEADAVLSQYGFETPAPVEPEQTEEPVVEPVEPEQTEEPVVEPVEPEQTEEPVVEPEPPIIPDYVIPAFDGATWFGSTNTWDVVGNPNIGDVMTVNDYTMDDNGLLWYFVTDYRTQDEYAVIADQMTAVDEETAQILMNQIDANQPTEPEQTEEPVVEPVEPEQTEEPVVEPVEPEQTEEPVVEPTTTYAVTNNRNSNTNNLREAQDGSAAIIQTYANDELVIVNSVSDDGLWYDVTVVRDGNRGYMRDYLLTQISEADALKRIDEINAGQTTPPSEETQTPAGEETQTPTGEETQTPTGEETQTPTGEETPKPAPEQMTFPAYGITVDTAATILLRDAPDGAIPQTGALKQINNPTPVRISGQETGANDQIWYLVENLNNGDAGYTEAYNVRIVSEQDNYTLPTVFRLICGR